MIYFLLYCIVGILLMILQQWISRQPPTLLDMVAQMEAYATRVIEKDQYPDGVPVLVSSARIIGESLAKIIGVLCWPVIAFNLLIRLKESRFPPDKGTEEETDHGTCICMVTLEEIERIEQIQNDGSEVPLPAFGFLNDRWLEFKAQVKEGDEIWAYRYTPYPGQPYDAWRHGAEGYLIKRNGKVVAKILSNAG